MAKRKAAAAEDGHETAHEEPAPTDAPPAAAEEVSVSKMEAVRRALAEGLEKGDDAIPWIKEKFGHDVNAANFSTMKSQIRSKERKAQGDGGATRATRKPRAVATPASAPAATEAKNGSIGDAVKAIKGLVETFGAAEVRKIVEAFE